MFNLIITIISIALVAVLAIATIYYGGSAFNQGSARAAAATLVNHGQQITGANTLYGNDHAGSFAADTSALQTGGYLSSVPKSQHNTSAGYTLAGVSSNMVTSELQSTAASVCDEVAKSINMATSAGHAPTADSTPGTTLDDYQAANTYGCVVDSADSNKLKFWFKG